MSCMGYSWPYPALVAPNGLISVDLGWIWVGYIQDGLLAPFGPTKIAIGVRGGVREWPKNVINQVFLAISGPGGSKWPDISGSWWDTSSMVNWYHLDPKKIPSGALRGS